VVKISPVNANLFLGERTDDNRTSVGHTLLPQAYTGGASRSKAPDAFLAFAKIG
jgi:hypothetical protein